MVLTAELILVLSEERETFCRLRALNPIKLSSGTLQSSERILLGSWGCDPAWTTACSKQQGISHPGRGNGKFRVRPKQIASLEQGCKSFTR